MKPTDDMIDAAALAIADTRESLKGRPGVGNIDWLSLDYRTQLLAEAEAALLAAFKVAPWAIRQIG